MYKNERSSPHLTFFLSFYLKILLKRVASSYVYSIFERKEKFVFTYFKRKVKKKKNYNCLLYSSFFDYIVNTQKQAQSKN